MARRIFALFLLFIMPSPACPQCTTCNQQPSQVYYNSQVAVQPANQARPGQFQPPTSVSRNQQIYVWYGQPQPIQNQALGVNGVPQNGGQPQYNPNGYNPNNNQQPVMYNNINRDQPQNANQQFNPNPNVQQPTTRPTNSIPGFVPPAGVPSTAFPYSTTTPAYNTVAPLAPITQTFDPVPAYLNTGSSTTAPFYSPTSTAAPQQQQQVYSTTAFPYSTQFNQGTPMPTGTSSPFYSTTPMTSTMAPSSTTTFYPSTTTSFYPSTTTTMAPPTSTFPSTTSTQPQFSPSTTLQPSQQQQQQQPYVLGSPNQQQQGSSSTFAPASTQQPSTTAPVQIGYNPAGQPIYANQPSTTTQAPFVSSTPSTPYAQPSTTPYGSQYPITGTPVNAGAIGVNNVQGSTTPYYPSTTPSPQQPFYSSTQMPQQIIGGSTTATPVYQIGQGIPGNTVNPQFNPSAQSSTYSPYAVGGSTLGNQVLYDPTTGLVTANGMNTMYGRYTTMEPGSQMMRDAPITNGGPALSLMAGVAALLFRF